MSQGATWMDLWEIRRLSGYSGEYVRLIVKSLLEDDEALERVRKGAKFLYRASVNADRVISEMETAQ